MSAGDVAIGVAIGLVSGVLAGSFGVGGGIVMTPGIQVLLGAPPIVALANGLFLQRDFAVQPEFLHTLAAQYGAGVRTVDFSSGAKEAIDAWAREQTADRIKKVFDELDPSTVVVIANTVYFRADWQRPFLDVTEGVTFNRADGTAVQTPMLHKDEEMRYATGSSWQAVELRYARGPYAMWVLVPRGKADPSALLSPEVLSTVEAGLRPAMVDLTMPKWDFESQPDLKALLIGLGLTAPFGAADFSGIASGLYIGQAVHAANITVDEFGTEAAAVAAIAMPSSAPPSPDIVVRADRPFAFAIVHLPTRTPLFLGTVADPTAK